MNPTSEQNKSSWNSNAYQAWLNRFGTPESAAAKLKLDPAKRLGKLYPHFGTELSGKKVINLLGSNGIKAVALALLGAEVTIVDFSADNEKYASELAAAAGVSLRYVQEDVTKLPESELMSQYDYVLMENGVLHYFEDLNLICGIAATLLASGGKFVLQDFHPVSTKLITSAGTTANIRKHKVTGDYFDCSLKEKNVAYNKYLDEGKIAEPGEKVYLREWTLGEVITAVALSGLRIVSFEELPNLSSDTFDKGIPKSFIISAVK